MVRSEDREPDIFVVIDTVVGALQQRTAVDPGSLLLVGAACRDVLHSSLGHRFPLRASTDIDLGIALRDWKAHHQSETAFPRIGSSGIRYLIAEVPVDVMPFGPLEDPEGITTPPRRGEELIVFGFNDVFERAAPLVLPSAGTMGLPSVPGYAALKMAAWADRSPLWIERDASDLALTVHWYQHSSEVTERVWGTPEGQHALERLDLLARRLDVVAEVPESTDYAYRRRIVEELTPVEGPEQVTTPTNSASGPIR